MNNRPAPAAACDRCSEQITRIGGAVLVLVVARSQPVAVLKAELVHQRCATPLQLAAGESSSVVSVSALAADPAAREELRQRARQQNEPIAAAIVRVCNLALRSGGRAAGKTARVGTP